MTNYYTSNLKPYGVSAPHLNNTKYSQSPVKRQVNFTGQTDTVTFSTHTQQSSSNKKKWWIGAIAAAGLAVITAIAVRGRIKNNSVTQLAEHIDFAPAKTLEEAKAFAKKHLGINKYELTDLEIANFINEGLVNLSNTFKGTKMFKRVKTLPKNHLGRMMCTSDGKTLGINENEILEAVKTKKLKEFFDEVSNKSNFSHFDLNKHQQELISRFKTEPEKLSLKERLELEDIISLINTAPTENYSRRYVEAMSNDNVIKVLKENNKILAPDDFLKLPDEERAKYMTELYNAGYKQPIYARGAFAALNHEFGHKIHIENIGRKEFEKICVNIDRDSNVAQQKVIEYMREFAEREPEAWPVLREVSWYAICSKAEAVAEIFAGLKNGVKYNDKVMALYKKWGGVIPPNA